MRILKQGVHPKEFEYHAKCRECNTEFAFFIFESQHFDCQREGSVWQVACPHKPCGSVVSIYKLEQVSGK